jgi:hypothetical protein
VIENTTNRVSQDMAAALMLATGDVSGVIENQERAGQQQLVRSDRLPTDDGGAREEFEAVGFTFGDPDPRDPMFVPATLPEGWKREGSDHAMWSYITDQHGRRRVSIFYKAAFYDRSAHMSLATVYGYLSDRVYDGQPVISDDDWATPAAILDAARVGIKRAGEEIDTWKHIGNAEYVAEYTAKRDAWAAIAAAHDNA